MSGICAVWLTDNPEHETDTLVRVARGLAPGPAERTELETQGDAGIAVSVRFASQQLFRDGSIVLACDADLTNEDELLECVGRKRGDGGKRATAALISALYRRFGAAFPEKLNGAFSVLVWDGAERTLLAAADRFGVKRLVYYRDRKVLLAGSRIDALLATGRVERDINPRAIANYLNFGVSVAPETIISGIQRLEPGVTMLATGEGLRLERYWDLRYGARGETGESRLRQQLASLVERSVAAHCGRDSAGSVGAFLSGGTDSSTVVGMMSRASHQPVAAFSIGFREQRFNELRYAELAAKRFGATHHTYLVGPDDCFDALPRMVRYFDEPFGNSSAIPTYFCAALAASQGVKVLLAGDGGDELFGGNERYVTDKVFELYQQVPRVARRALIEPVLAGFPARNGVVGIARKYVSRSNLPSPERFFSYNFLYAHPATEVFEPDFLNSLEGYSILDVPERHYRRAQARSRLDRLLYVDVKITLGDSDLPKVTCMSELAGVQDRFPFLDKSVAEFSASLPPRFKVRGFQKRYLFKQAFRNLLPREIITKKKHGFGIPVSTWLRTDPRLRELARDTLGSSRARKRGYFRQSFIEELFRRHERDESTYYGDTLWTFLTLELWHREFTERAVGAAS